MITSIFSKSKAINFIIVFFITLLAFFTARLKLSNFDINVEFVFEQIALFFLCYATILIVNFIVDENRLSKNTKYEILLFSLFILSLSQITMSLNIMCSNLFVLLGLYRIMRMRLQTHLYKKLFDSSLFIAIGALFYFWSILFFILIFISLLLNKENKINYWLIPFTGVLTVFIITTSLSIVFNSNFFISLPEVSFDYSNYNSARYLIPITILLSFGTWSSWFYVKNIKKKKKTFRASFNIIFVAVLISFLIIVLAPNKNGSEFLYIFTPLTIIITNYIEIIEENWFKEIFLLALVLMPFGVLLFL